MRYLSPENTIIPKVITANTITTITTETTGYGAG
ncbi:Thr operon leader peptide [Xenorhabdus innexi]|uniref:Thr operon leader peptide n=1 Tax=Xenorhabdus innexi TaxID=290109 RepID=A0A2G0NQN9_9GAMM|nr:Thr operon leader peptide [Xenorhabdus innexi]